MTRRTGRLVWAAMLARDARLLLVLPAGALALLALFPSDRRWEAPRPAAHGEPRRGEAP